MELLSVIKSMEDMPQKVSFFSQSPDHLDYYIFLNFNQRWPRNMLRENTAIL